MPPSTLIFMHIKKELDQRTKIGKNNPKLKKHKRQNNIAWGSFRESTFCLFYTEPHQKQHGLFLFPQPEEKHTNVQSNPYGRKLSFQRI